MITSTVALRWVGPAGLPLLVLGAFGPGIPLPPGAGPTVDAHGAEEAARLPFLPGEELRYAVSLGRFGGAGTGTMRIEGVERLRGREVYRLAFDFSGRAAGLARVQDRTRSWLDPARMATMRFEKSERTPLWHAEEAVDVFPEQRRWTDATGGGGTTAHPAPLDELSFLYFIRTLTLAPGERHLLQRHFDADRNPVRISVVGRERILVPAGEFAAIVVEMQVQDGRRYGGAGILRLHLTDDARRIPVRIASSMPVVGATVLELTALPRVSLRP